MPKIINWERLVHRNIRDVEDSMRAVVRKWRHQETGETVSIEYVNDDQSPNFLVNFDGDLNNKKYKTLDEAVSNTIPTLRLNPSGMG